MTYQQRPSISTRQRSRSVKTFVAITLAGITAACSDSAYLGDTQSLAGAPSSANFSTSSSSVGSDVGGAGVSSNGSGAMSSGAMSSGAMSSGATGAMGSGAMGSGATGATGSGAMGSGATGATGSGAMGSGATGATGSGATGSGATGSGATGATGSGATGNVGGSTAFVCNLDIQCFRAVECVERCGGPVLQSSCCPCPDGTFDSISCGVGGAPSTGGAGNQGGATAQGGATSSGGTTTTILPGNECTADKDCRIEGDCCGCYSFGPGQSSSCPMECLTSTTCSGFDPQPAPRCIAGRCTLNRSCDDRKVTCKRMTPQCDAGKLPSLMEGDLCWDGNCIDIVDCSAVTGCDVCKSNGLMCVYDADSDVAHCVAQPVECAAASRCTCHRGLCGTKTCSDTATGISCSG